jgi:hypothetical protein
VKPRLYKAVKTEKQSLDLNKVKITTTTPKTKQKLKEKN